MSAANAKVENDSQGSIEEMIDAPNNDINKADLNIESINMNMDNNKKQQQDNNEDEDEI